MRNTWTTWVLTLGLALAILAGPAASVATTVTTPGMPQDEGTAALGDTGDLSDRGDEVVVLGLSVRWGYLHDPPVAAFEGKWRFNEDGDGGVFSGHWRVIHGHLFGTMRGVFEIRDDGRGPFRGEWDASNGDAHGVMKGVWVRVERAHGVLDGRWSFANGRPGGAMSGHWAALDDDGGVFRGRMIRAPTMKPVNWDGFLQTTDGAVSVHHTVRWETGGHRHMGGGDKVFPQTDRQTVEWRSTTTTNWDGLVFVLKIPRVDPAPHITLHTDQASFVWEAREIPGLRIRERTDDLGHAIEVRGFVIDMHEDREVARMDVLLRWGMLDERAHDGPGDVTTWNGGARVTHGRMAVRGLLSFERGDVLHRDGPQAVTWHTTTTTGWDGVRLRLLVPLDDLGEATFGIRTGGFDHIFRVTELPGDHVFDVDDAGNQFHVRAHRA